MIDWEDLDQIVTRIRKIVQETPSGNEISVPVSAVPPAQVSIIETPSGNYITAPGAPPVPPAQVNQTAPVQTENIPTESDDQRFKATIQPYVPKSGTDLVAMDPGGQYGVGVSMMLFNYHTGVKRGEPCDVRLDDVIKARQGEFTVVGTFDDGGLEDHLIAVLKAR